MKTLFLMSLLILSSVPIFGQTVQDKVRQTAEMFVAAYNSKDYARIEKEFSAPTKAAISTERLKRFLDDTHIGFGRIVKLGAPDFAAPNAAVFPIEFENAKMVLMVSIDVDGKIAGLRVAPPPSTRPRNTARNQTKLTLPFRGEWLVFWGGDTVRQNYHQDVPSQRFAFDILKVDASGKSYRGDGKKNEDYYAFGQEIIAPADGIVISVKDGVHDNVPGEMNRKEFTGNTVVVKHAENEYSFFAHFKQNSIRVKAGDKVTKGQVLGLCGNSGNSSEPHLHYQLQNAPTFGDEATMKVFFEKVTVKANGKTEVKTDYSPVKGNVVSN